MFLRKKAFAYYAELLMQCSLVVSPMGVAEKFSAGVLGYTVYKIKSYNTKICFPFSYVSFVVSTFEFYVLCLRVVYYSCLENIICLCIDQCLLAG